MSQVTPVVNIKQLDFQMVYPCAQDYLQTHTLFVSVQIGPVGSRLEDTYSWGWIIDACLRSFGFS